MEELSGSDLLNLIESSFPKLKIKDTKFLDYGWNNHIVIVNNDIIFRIPKNKRNELSLKNEINLLKILKNCPFSIPDYIYLNYNKIFFGGYSMIQGDFLQNSTTLGRGLRNDFSSLASFFGSIRAEDVEKTGMPVYNHKTWIGKELKMIGNYRRSLGEIMPETLFDEIEEKWDTVSDDMEDGDMAFIHGDLYRKNVIISNNHRKINGILDWADSSYGDRALDYAAFGFDFSLNENRLLLANSEKHFSERAMKRVNFYRKTEGFYLAHYLSKTGKIEEARKECIRIAETWKKIRQF